MNLKDRRKAADALIERLQALGLKPGASVILYAATIPEWAWDQMAIMESCNVIEMTEITAHGNAAVLVAVGSAVAGIFKIEEMIKGASDGS